MYDTSSTGGLYLVQAEILRDQNWSNLAVQGYLKYSSFLHMFLAGLLPCPHPGTSALWLLFLASPAGPRPESPLTACNTKIAEAVMNGPVAMQAKCRDRSVAIAKSARAPSR